MGPVLGVATGEPGPAGAVVWPSGSPLAARVEATRSATCAGSVIEWWVSSPSGTVVGDGRGSGSGPATFPLSGVGVVPWTPPLWCGRCRGGVHERRTRHWRRTAQSWRTGKSWIMSVIQQTGHSAQVERPLARGMPSTAPASSSGARTTTCMDLTRRGTRRPAGVCERDREVDQVCRRLAGCFGVILPARSRADNAHYVK